MSVAVNVLASGAEMELALAPKASEMKQDGQPTNELNGTNAESSSSGEDTLGPMVTIKSPRVRFPEHDSDDEEEKTPAPDTNVKSNAITSPNRASALQQMIRRLTHDPLYQDSQQQQQNQQQSQQQPQASSQPSSQPSSPRKPAPLVVAADPVDRRPTLDSNALGNASTSNNSNGSGGSLGSGGIAGRQSQSAAGAGLTYHAMISYSRRDMLFVDKLVRRCDEASLRIWVDFRCIPKAVDWWQEIERGIQSSCCFVLVITPDAAKSKYCRGELDLARRFGKRIIPILALDTVTTLLHPAIRAINWIDFQEDSKFDEAFAAVKRAILYDPQHLYYHTRLLIRALEWQEAARERDKLRRQRELRHRTTTAANNAMMNTVISASNLNSALDPRITRAPTQTLLSDVLSDDEKKASIFSSGIMLSNTTNNNSSTGTNNNTAVDMDEEDDVAGLLLMGPELKKARQWLEKCSREKLSPSPTALHHMYVYLSEEQEKWRAGKMRIMEAFLANDKQEDSDDDSDADDTQLFPVTNKPAKSIKNNTKAISNNNTNMMSTSNINNNNNNSTAITVSDIGTNTYNSNIRSAAVTVSPDNYSSADYSKGGPPTPLSHSSSWHMRTKSWHHHLEISPSHWCAPRIRRSLHNRRENSFYFHFFFCLLVLMEFFISLTLSILQQQQSTTSSHIAYEALQVCLHISIAVCMIFFFIELIFLFFVHLFRFFFYFHYIFDLLLLIGSAILEFYFFHQFFQSNTNNSMENSSDPITSSPIWNAAGSIYFPYLIGFRFLRLSRLLRFSISRRTYWLKTARKQLSVIKKSEKKLRDMIKVMEREKKRQELESEERWRKLRERHPSRRFSNNTVAGVQGAAGGSGGYMSAAAARIANQREKMAQQTAAAAAAVAAIGVNGAAVNSGASNANSPTAAGGIGGGIGSAPTTGMTGVSGPNTNRLQNSNSASPTATGQAAGTSGAVSSSASNVDGAGKSPAVNHRSTAQQKASITVASSMIGGVHDHDHDRDLDHDGGFHPHGLPTIYSFISADQQGGTKKDSLSVSTTTESSALSSAAFPLGQSHGRALSNAAIHNNTNHHNTNINNTNNSNAKPTA